MEAAETLSAEGLAGRGEGEEDERDEQTCEHKYIEIRSYLYASINVLSDKAGNDRVLLKQNTTFYNTDNTIYLCIGRKEAEGDEPGIEPARLHYINDVT